MRMAGQKPHKDRKNKQPGIKGRMDRMKNGDRGYFTPLDMTLKILSHKISVFSNNKTLIGTVVKGYFWSPSKVDISTYVTFKNVYVVYWY